MSQEILRDINNLRTALEAADQNSLEYEDGMERLENFINKLVVAGLLPEHFPESSSEIAEITFEAGLLSCREGAYLSSSKISAMIAEETINIRKRNYATVLRDIATNHDESLFHLCVSNEIVSKLHRASIWTINDLRHRIETQGVISGKQIGEKTKDDVYKALTAFDQLIDKTSN